MKTKNQRRMIPSLLAAALVLGGVGVSKVQALTITCPKSMTIECGSPLNFDLPTYTNACCTNVTVVITTNIVSGSSCNSTHTRVWMVSDCCTNFPCSQTITVVDTTPPVITCAPITARECGSVWTFDRPTATDACCGTNLNYWFLGSNVVSSSQCQTWWEGRWQVSDCCSNYSLICTQLIVVRDTTPPTFSNIPPSKTVECGTNWTFEAAPTAYDNCSGSNLPVSFSMATFGTCPQTITRSWTAVDSCSNSATCVQSITVVDTTPPVITCASNKTVQCGSQWTVDRPFAIDACCGTNLNYWFLGSNVVSSTQCQTVWAGLWQVSDCCSNYSSICTQLVAVVDTTPPVIISCASNKTIQCSSPLTFDPPTATDNCCPSNSLIPELINSYLVSSDPCRKVYAGRWRVRDCCTNYSLVCTQYVEVVDTLAPVFTVIPSNMVFNCTCAGGNNVSYNVSAVDNCETNIAVICTPPSGSRFPVGTNLVTCIARDTCGNQTNYSFTITILSNCPVYNCITIQCPGNIRLPCDGFDNTLVNWTVTASNSCSPGNVVTWSDPPSPALFGLGTHYVTGYASNTVLCEVKQCSFTVEIFPRGPRLSARRGSGTFGTNSLLINYAESCGEFAIEWIHGLGLIGSGGSDWSPFSGLPTGSWSQQNQTNNIAERIIGFDLPDWGTRPDASFFRLSSEIKRGKDFSSVALGPFTNAAIPTPPHTVNFIRPNNSPMQVVDLGTTHGLLADDVGIIASMPTGMMVWPDRLYDPPTFHEVEVQVLGFPGEPHACWYAEAFDTTGQMVEAFMTTNAPATVTLRSIGYPLHHIKLFTEANESVGLVSLKGRTDYTLPIDQLGECLDFRSFPTNTVVPNPWSLPGHTIGSTNALGMVEPITYIEAGPDGYGNGYHVNYSTTIHLTTNCCRHIQVELIKYASPVQVSAYGESGTELASHVVTQTGTPYTVDFPPTSSPICKLVVTSPDDQTRILRICCLPALQTIPPPTWCPGTNSNPLVAACNSNVTQPVTYQLVSGGLLSNLLYTYLFPHGGFTVFDLGNESLATIAMPCSKVVVEVFSENPNNGMELEAADVNGFVVARGGPLEASQTLQTVVLSGSGIKTVRFKCPAAQGYLKAFYGLP